MSRRAKWNRRKWYAARHQSRMLLRLYGVTSPPPLVAEYMRLIEMHGLDRMDPLTMSVRYRFALKYDDVPF